MLFDRLANFSFKVLLCGFGKADSHGYFMAKVASEIESNITTSFQRGKYRWRTAQSLAREAGINAHDMADILENSGIVIRAGKPNARGQALYALREKLDSSRPFFQRIISIVTNQPD